MWNSTKMLLQAPVQRQFLIPNSPHIHSFGAEAINRRGASNGVPAAPPWPTTNLGLLFEFVTEEPFQAASFFLQNGSTVSGNFCMAVQRVIPGTATVERVATTGSVAQSGTSAEQFVAVSFLLPAGRYLCQLRFDNTTGTVYAQTPSQGGPYAGFGAAQVAGGSVTIGSTETLAEMDTAMMPYFGISKGTSF